MNCLRSDITGTQRRYRRDASAQKDRSSAVNEAHELHQLAMTTGSPFGTTNSGMLTFGAFCDDSYRELSWARESSPQRAPRCGRARGDGDVLEHLATSRC
jgi:hypothetical protein